MKRVLQIAMIGLIPWWVSAQQLVITEVMSDSSDTKDGVVLVPGQDCYPGPDHWELTNYGTNDLDLNGYSISDHSTNRFDALPFVGLIIHAGETLIFFRSRPLQGYTNAANFIHWWWGECQGAPVDIADRIRTYDVGLADTGDELWLYEPSGRVADRAVFGEAKRGISFRTCPGSSLFGCFSQLGVEGAFRACTADDIGSPGLAPPPIPLSFTQHPVSQTACGGATVALRAQASGLPRPRFQWFFNGTALVESSRLSGIASDTLAISDFQAVDAGEYWVVAGHALQSVTSHVASLGVTFDDQPPALLESFSGHLPCLSRCPTRLPDQEVFSDQPAVFGVWVSGCPAPHLRWFTNDVLVPDAAGPVLEIPPTGLDPASLPVVWQISVTASNAFGSVTDHTRLTIVERPSLAITEAMSWPSVAFPPEQKEDYFELTNLGGRAVRLRGYRFFDTYDRCAAFVLTNDVVMRPNESIVFVADITPETFRAWWGAGQLPASLQIITFAGFGFRAGANNSEPIVVWNPGARDDDDYVTSACYVTYLQGVSLIPDEDGYLLNDSMFGERGAIRAEHGGDIGSPGFWREPWILSIRPDLEEVRIDWRACAGMRYQVVFAETLDDDPVWTSWPVTVQANDDLAWIRIPQQMAVRQRFFKVVEVP